MSVESVCVPGVSVGNDVSCVPGESGTVIGVSDVCVSCVPGESGTVIDVSDVCVSCVPGESGTVIGVSDECVCFCRLVAGTSEAAESGGNSEGSE